MAKRKLTGETQRPAAKKLGMSQPALNQALKKGRTTANPDGSIDVERSRRELAENTDRSKPRNHLTGNPKGRRPPDGPSVPMGGVGGDTPTSGGQTYNHWRTAREAVTAATAKLEYEERVGNLVSVDTVVKETFEIHRRVRDQLLAMAPRLAPLVAHRSVEECEREIAEDVGRVLEELSTPPAATRAH